LPPPVQVFQKLVARTIVPVSSKIVAVLRRVKRSGSVAYASLFSGARSKSDLVATFLAVLELYKMGAILIRQDQNFGSLWLIKQEAKEEIS